MYSLSVTKSVAPASIVRGGSAVWTVTVTNTGPDPMTRGDTVDLADTLPGPGTYIVNSITTSGGSNPNLTSGAMTCTGVTVGAAMPASTVCSRAYSAVAGTPQAPSGGTRGLNAGESLTITYTQAVGAATCPSTSPNTATTTDRSSTSGTIGVDQIGVAASKNATNNLSIVCPTITPVTESGTATAGIASTPIANVAANDTVNGVAATLGPAGNATVAQFGVWPAGITLDPLTGTISTTAAVAPGIYSVAYQLCDKNSPPNCATVTDTVTVVGSDMVPSFTGGGLPTAIGPGQTITVAGGLTCTNNGPGLATAPTCTASTTTLGAIVSTASCSSPALPLAVGGTIVCNLVITAPSNPGGGGDVPATSVAVTGATGATNDSNGGRRHRRQQQRHDRAAGGQPKPGADRRHRQPRPGDDQPPAARR